jgi:cephalosporin-C deacetylase-like acetyl esterase
MNTMQSIRKFFFLSFLCCVVISLNAGEPVLKAEVSSNVLDWRHQCNEKITAERKTAGPIVKLEVTADHADWLYKPNEKVVFKVAVFLDGKPMKGTKVYYEIGAEKMPPTIKKEVEFNGAELVIDAGTMLTGGFLRCTATVEHAGKKYRGLATAAFSPETITPTTTTPDDFSEFWTNAIAENANIPMDTQIEPLPNLSNDKVNVFQVNIQNHKIGMRLYGILCVPKAPGKYPALLRVPGAGVRGYKGDVRLAEKGIITFQIGIHGIPVTLDSMIYENLKSGALLGYPTFNLDNRDNYFYKHVYLGCVRANDFIYSLPEFDGTNLMVAGGSQGGALSIVTAALDKRVKALSCFYPALSDLNGYQNGRAGGWPHMFNKKENARKEKVETSRYYDVVNFARLITVPGFYSFGYNDETCPPTSMYASFNSISTSKSFFIVKETGHTTNVDQRNKETEFILKSLNVSNGTK